MSMEGPKQNSNELFNGDSWVLPTDINLVGPAEADFEKRLVGAEWDEDDIFKLMYAFREALINSITHGNLGIKKKIDGEDLATTAAREQSVHPTNKKIYITIEVGKNKVSLKLRDEGEGFKQAEVQDPTEQGLLDVKGRGIFLMKQFFDSVTYNEKGNEVTMIKEKK